LKVIYCSIVAECITVMLTTEVSRKEILAEQEENVIVQDFEMTTLYMYTWTFFSISWWFILPFAH